MNKRKWQSRRWYVVLWAIIYVSVMSWYSIEKNDGDSWVVIAIVAGIIVSYVTVSSLKKKEGE